MENLYNPDLMPEAEIKQTFVARQPLVDELVALVGKQPDGAGVQHVVVIAPRGMGKTTVFLMTRFAVRDGNLARRWQAVQFPEERYGINDLADFWLEILHHLEIDTNDAELRRRIEEIKAEYTNTDDLQEAALALIKDWRRKHKKRLVVLVDNFDMILEQINDEQDNARLRDALMNDGTVMIIGGATTFFHEARAYDQPLYNFFKIYNLDNLKFAQMQDLLRKRAAIDEIANFEEVLKANHSRLRVLEYFTGGNPRLVLMLYRVITQSDISEVRRGLEKLLDEVTPYYKSKIESLPPQQRKILDHIARISSQTNEGLTPTEIAHATRMTPNQASAQLKRLSESGYVQAANIRSGRNTYYTLSERLYAIWHQMRFGRNARERMGWLVNILKALYDAEELREQSDILDSRFGERLSAGLMRGARDVLEHHRYLAEAMDDAPTRLRAMESIIRGHLELKNFEILKNEILTPAVLQNLPENILKSLYDAGCITKKSISHANALASSSKSAQQKAEKASALKLSAATLAISEGRMSDAVKYFDRALEVQPDEYAAWILRGLALDALERYEDAIASFDRGLKLKPDEFDAWFVRGVTFIKMNRHEEAFMSLDHALQIKPDDDFIWYIRGMLLYGLKKFEEAIASFDHALDIKTDHSDTWRYRGDALDAIGNYDKAIESYDHALDIKPDNQDVWVNRGSLLCKLGKYEEGIADFDHALSIHTGVADIWLRRGAALTHFHRYDEALASINSALEIQPDNHNILWYRATVLNALFRPEEAIQSLDRALEVKPDFPEIRESRTLAYLLKFISQILQNDIALAKQTWNAALKSTKHGQVEDWHERLLEALLMVAARGHLEFVRELIIESELEQPLLPLTRAIDYLLTGDETLIEKLSPEVRGVVDEIISKLRKPVDGTKAVKNKPRGSKLKAGARRRTRKQLR